MTYRDGHNLVLDARSNELQVAAHMVHALRK